MDYPKTVSEFFQFAIHVLYGIILTTSFELTDIFIPVETINPFINFHRFVNILALLMIYIILISGWMGYTKSIVKREHRGLYGNGRFVIDIMIIFLLQYMIHLVNQSSPHNYFQNQFKDVFIWVIPAIYVLYTIWDILKYYEYKDDSNSEKKIDGSRIIITIIFLVITITIGGIYSMLLYYGNIDIYNQYNFYLYFIITSIIVTMIYRLIKWEDKPKENRIHKPSTM